MIAKLDTKINVKNIVEQLPPETQMRYRVLCALEGKSKFDHKLKSHLEHKVNKKLGAKNELCSKKYQV